MASIEIGTIDCTSATLSETMRLCPLRAGLSKAAGSDDVTIGNPKSWLGTAYHSVLEKISTADFGNESLDAAVERLWRDAVDRQYAINSQHPLNHRFGPPESWPGYYLCRASVFLRAREVVPVGPIGEELTNGVGGTPSSGVIREQRFTALQGMLVGKPDVIRFPEVIDYKSSGVTEWDETTQSETIKLAYARQLRIYGFLVKEALGWWPTRAILLPPVGEGAEVLLAPEDCASEARAAVSLLQQYNAEVNSSATAEALASPSVAACKWCSFKLVCDRFWIAVDDAWASDLPGAVVEGIVEQDPVGIHGGAAIALSVRVESGTQLPGVLRVAPLNPAVHFLSRVPTGGERIRVTGLRVRGDGVLVPSKQTIVATTAELPLLELRRGNT